MRSGKSSGSNNRSPRWFRIKRNEDLPVNSLNSCPVEVWTEFGIREYVAGNNWGRAANNVTSGRLKQDSLLRVSGHAGVIKRRDLRPVGWLDAKARGPNEQNACNLLQRLARPPVHSSAVKTNFASMYRIWSSNESPKPSRPIALTVSLTYRMRTSQNSSLLAPPSARHIPAHALKQGWSCTPAWTTCRSSTSRPYGAIGPPAQTACRASARRPQGLACVVAVGQCVLAQGVLALCWRCAWRLEFERVDRLEAIVCGGPSVELWNQGNIPNT